MGTRKMNPMHTPSKEKHFQYIDSDHSAQPWYSGDAYVDITTLVIPSLTKAVFNGTFASTPLLAYLGASGYPQSLTSYILTDAVLDLFRKTVVNKMFGWTHNSPGVGGTSASLTWLTQFEMAAMCKAAMVQSGLVGMYYSWLGDGNAIPYALASFISQVIYEVAYTNWACVKNPLIYTCTKDGKA